MITRTRVSSMVRKQRDEKLYEDYKSGMAFNAIAAKYFTTEKNAKDIVRQMTFQEKTKEKKETVETKKSVEKIYKLVEADTLSDLVEGVNALLKEGYMPIGSPANMSNMGRVFVQAMIK